MALDLHDLNNKVGQASDLQLKLNAEFSNLTQEQRIKRLYDYFDASEVLLTSSFGGSSALILELFSKVNNAQKIHFIDTGYHFDETLKYKDQLSAALGMDVISVHPDPSAHELTKKEQWWIDRANDCCGVNKVDPLDAILPNYKVWVSGVMAYQTPQRAHFKIFEESNHLFKFHPIIDMDETEGNRLIAALQLPQHPLTFQGYGSIGCKYCTFQGKGREGRWTGSDKTECGLHTVSSILTGKEN